MQEASSPPRPDRDERLQLAFAEEEYSGLVLATRLRFAALAIIGAWLTVENGFPDVLFFYVFLLAAAALGIIPFLLRWKGWAKPWHRYLFPLLDASLVVAAILVPNPLDQFQFPHVALNLRYGNEIYLFIMLTAGLFTYSPRLVLWTGLAASIVWSLGTLWVISLPDTLVDVPANWAELTTGEKVEAFMDPRRVYYGPWGRLVVTIIVVAGLMAAAVQRSRRLVIRELESERRRANLSRYFSANLVEDLSQSDDPIASSRSQNVAILFADVVGFTSLSERRTPEEVIDLLREFHSRTERAVFANGGTLDKYIGDGLMVTFGTPTVGDRDAGNALRCARAMLRSMDEWNVERTRAGQAEVQIGIGVHYGPVIAGDIGGEQRLEYTVIGDSVNVASRLERLTRDLDALLVVSEDLLTAARAELKNTTQNDESNIEEDEIAAALAGLVPMTPQELRGRSVPLPILALPRT